MPFTNTFKSLTSPVALERLDENFADLLSAASGKGDELLTTKHSGSNSVSRTQHELNEVVLLSNKFATLQDALNAAAGKRLIIVPGSYAMGSTTLSVPDNTRVEAYGATFTWTSNVTGVSLGSGGSWAGGSLTGSGNTSYNDAGRAFACSGTNNSPLAPTYKTGPKIRDVTITEWSGYGVRLQYCNGGEVSSCNITECGYSGVAVMSCNDVIVEKNIIDGVSPGSGGGDAYGIFFDRLETGNETVEPRTYRTRVAYNVVKNVAATTGNNGQGIDTHGSVDAQIIGNMVENCEVGIVLTASSISGVQQLACKRANVAGNTIRNTSRIGYGILVSGALSGTTVNEYAEGIVLSGNVVEGHGIAADSLTGAIFCQATRNLVINGGAVIRPSPHGVRLNLENRAFNVSGLSIIDPYDNSVSIPSCVIIDGNNNTGFVGNVTCRFENSGLGTNVAVFSLRIGSGLTGLDLEMGRFDLVGIDSSHLSYSEATSTGVSAAGFCEQRGQVTLSSGTANVSFAKRMPTTSYYISLSTSSNETMRWSSKSATGFTITSSNGSSTASVDWTVTT